MAPRSRPPRAVENPYLTMRRSVLVSDIYSLTSVLRRMHGSDEFFDRLFVARSLMQRALEAHDRALLHKWEQSGATRLKF